MKKIFNRKTGVQSVYLLAGALALVIVILVNIAAGTLAERYPSPSTSPATASSA